MKKGYEVEKGLLTADEVGKQLGISSGQVLVLSREGKLKRLRIGFRTIRFIQEEVDRFIRDEQNAENLVPEES